MTLSCPDCGGKGHFSICEPVGVPELAERLGVKHTTPHTWMTRGVMPEADWIVSGNKAWRWGTILRWAGERGRILNPVTMKEYEEVYGEPPRPPRRGGPLPEE